MGEAASVVLVHGAGSGPWVFDSWKGSFGDADVRAVDLQEGLRVETASMADYALRVVRTVERASRPVALCGWSMGGLVALMAAAESEPDALVLIEPSPPAEVQGWHPEVALSAGAFDPEEVYGAFPETITPRPESLLARLERKRGISVAQVPCPTLVVSGRSFPEDRGVAVAAHYGAEALAFPDLHHGQLVSEVVVGESIHDWLGSVL